MVFCEPPSDHVKVYDGWPAATAAARAAAAAASAALGHPGCSDALRFRFGAIAFQTGLDWTGRSPSALSSEMILRSEKLDTI